MKHCALVFSYSSASFSWCWFCSKILCGGFFCSWNQLGRMDSMEAMRLFIRTLEVGSVHFFWIRVICHHCGVVWKQLAGWLLKDGVFWYIVYWSLTLICSHIWMIPILICSSPCLLVHVGGWSYLVVKSSRTWQRGRTGHCRLLSSVCTWSLDWRSLFISLFKALLYNI
jgi:hypothetical protein